MAARANTLAVLAFALLALLLAAPASHAQATAGACGHRLSPPILAKWKELGGATGALGCPTADETPGSTSPQGSKANEADFVSGMILWHVTGPRAGQTFALTGCIWRLYFQYGGPSGWLGLPTDDPENFPDGRRQSFEGGRITYLRAPNNCSAEHSSEMSQAPPAAARPTATSPLDAWFDPARNDHLSAASAYVAKAAANAHYQRVGPQARVLDAAAPGTAPLKLFWNNAKGDHLTTATDEGERNAFASGYEFEASQGFVWTDPHPGAVTLEQFRDPASGRHWLTAGPDEAAQAKAAGYRFERIEGYAPTP
ncbi:MAG: LGFP repeat-containing protein [Caulobacteraceae bacterium]